MNELERFWKLPEGYEKNFLPYANEIERFLHERYLKGSIKGRKFFYAIKPVIPRFFQILLRKRYARHAKIRFPHWPIEPFLEDLKRKILDELEGMERTPFIWFWPGKKNFAFVLTHDVESKKGFENIKKMCEIEKRYGMRSAWFFVTEKYPVPDALIAELKEQNHEVGVHGLKHDGKLFDSRKIFDERMQKLKTYGTKWNAVGFRSPSLLRNFEWIKVLPFQYDSSFPDTDPYGPQPGGCLSIFPFFLGDVIELPITMPQDHTLFVILGKKDIGIWKKKIDWIEKMNGMALVIVHPDYFDEKMERHYAELLEYLSSKNNLWLGLPDEVCQWWRSRDISSIDKDKNGNFTICGDAKERGSLCQLEKIL